MRKWGQWGIENNEKMRKWDKKINERKRIMTVMGK